ncbi:hypothetical protein [Ralstonia sp. ASV6]|uniref:hypothetical protein n=1 Tax=Ralstonia sp. ASV6 TaxID=2795124 RepID=UPI0018EAAA67|nr:hypothetical protein [Ralstonia sp. ASV6]
MREHYRGELVAYVIAQLGYGEVDSLESGMDASASDCYITADLSGWPEGFPGAASDNMGNWTREAQAST